jgi:hypothetical protein
MPTSVLDDEVAGKFYIRVKLRASLSPNTKQKIFVLFSQRPLLSPCEGARGWIPYFIRPLYMKHKINE